LTTAQYKSTNHDFGVNQFFEQLQFEQLQFEQLQFEQLIKSLSSDPL
jgi:hypothetical protein